MRAKVFSFCFGVWQNFKRHFGAASFHRKLYEPLRQIVKCNKTHERPSGKKKKKILKEFWTWALIEKNKRENDDDDYRTSSTHTNKMRNLKKKDWVRALANFKYLPIILNFPAFDQRRQSNIFVLYILILSNLLLFKILETHDDLIASRHPLTKRPRAPFVVEKRKCRSNPFPIFIEGSRRMHESIGLRERQNIGGVACLPKKNF